MFQLKKHKIQKNIEDEQDYEEVNINLKLQDFMDQNKINQRNVKLSGDLQFIKNQNQKLQTIGSIQQDQTYNIQEKTPQIDKKLNDLEQIILNDNQTFNQNQIIYKSKMNKELNEKERINQEYKNFIKKSLEIKLLNKQLKETDRKLKMQKQTYLEQLQKLLQKIENIQNQEQLEIHDQNWQSQNKLNSHSYSSKKYYNCQHSPLNYINQINNNFQKKLIAQVYNLQNFK